MRSPNGSPSTLWRLRPAIYGAAQNSIVSEISTQPRNNWPSQEFGGELALLMPHVPVGVKETKKKKKTCFLSSMSYNFNIVNILLFN